MLRAALKKKSRAALDLSNVVLIYRCPVLSLCSQADVTFEENQRKESSSEQQCLLILSSTVLLVSLYHFASPVNLFIYICYAPRLFSLVELSA